MKSAVKPADAADVERSHRCSRRRLQVERLAAPALRCDRHLAAKLGTEGIRVAAVSPGLLAIRALPASYRNELQRRTSIVQAAAAGTLRFFGRRA